MFFKELYKELLHHTQGNIIQPCSGGKSRRKNGGKSGGKSFEQNIGKTIVSKHEGSLAETHAEKMTEQTKQMDFNCV